jgi:hypothetical protein
MRVILLTAAASTLALGAAGCAPHPDYAHRTALDCPDRQGKLERTGIAPDRKSCTYRGSDGAEITLQLTPVSGDAASTLSAIETSLVSPAAGKTAAGGAAPPKAPAAPQPAAASADAAKAAAEASRDAHAPGDQDWDTGRHHSVTVDHDGKEVAVGDENDTAHIHLPGVHIDAQGDEARVDIGGIHVDANPDEATMRVFRDVRLRGQAFSREKNGLRATFIAKRDNLPDGYRYVGYEASGPKTGPLTVAIVKSRSEVGHGSGMLHDLERLVRRNGGA